MLPGVPTTPARVAPLRPATRSSGVLVVPGQLDVPSGRATGLRFPKKQKRVEEDVLALGDKEDEMTGAIEQVLASFATSPGSGSLGDFQATQPRNVAFYDQDPATQAVVERPVPQVPVAAVEAGVTGT